MPRCVRVWAVARSAMLVMHGLLEGISNTKSEELEKAVLDIPTLEAEVHHLWMAWQAMDGMQ